MAKPRVKGNGNGAVYETPSGKYRWEATTGFSSDGKRIKKRGTCATKKEAEKALRSYLVAYEKGEAVVSSKVTFGGWLNQWLERREGKMAPKTVHSQGYLVSHYIAPALGKKKIQEVSKMDLQRFYDSLNRPIYGNGKVKNQPMGASAQKQIHNIIKPALQEALKLDLISRNPASEIKPEPIKKQEGQVSEDKVWTLEEAKRVLQAARMDRYGYIFEFMLLTGVRKGEALGLRWSSIDFEAGYLLIQDNRVSINGKAINSTPKTPNSIRKIFLSPDVKGVLERMKLQQLEDAGMWLESWEDSGYVFTNERSGKPSHPENLAQGLDRIQKAAQVKRITIHGIRHTHASLAAAQGVKIEVLSKQLGHSKASFTLDVYRTVYESERQNYALDLALLEITEVTQFKSLN